MEPTTTGKRIVSKREYVRLVGKREALRWGSVGLAVTVAVCVLSCVGCIIAGALADGIEIMVLWFIVAALCFAVAWIIKRTAEKAMQKALRKRDAIPLTRANTADLPAPESLVRASAEPVQEQQAVLLRAAAERQEKHEEQLLRAASGQEYR